MTQNGLGLSERSLFKPVRFAYIRERFLPIVKYEGSRAKDKEKEKSIKPIVVNEMNIIDEQTMLDCTESFDRQQFNLVSFLYEKKICSGINVRKLVSPNRSIRL